MPSRFLPAKMKASHCKPRVSLSNHRVRESLSSAQPWTNEADLKRRWEALALRLPYLVYATAGVLAAQDGRPSAARDGLPNRLRMVIGMSQRNRAPWVDSLGLMNLRFRFDSPREHHHSIKFG